MKVKLIYLAAGNSRRFGRNKLLYEWDGKEMYRHLLERLVRICKRHEEWEVIVVTQYEEICRAAEAMQIRVVYSPDSVKGASWTIRAGMQAACEPDMQNVGALTDGFASNGVAACAFFVADQPYLTEETAETFLVQMEQKAIAEGDGVLGCVAHGGQTGNPVWFSRAYFRELTELEGDQGGKKVFRRYEEQAVYFPIEEERELKDIDRLE